jgi:hypothetical protein
MCGGTSLEGRSIIANSDNADDACRTLDWKVIVGVSPGNRELYHVAVDAAESENLVLQPPD